MQWLVLVLSVLFQASATPSAYDVSALKVGRPVAVVELDLGKLKGDLRQVSWSPDTSRLYIQTAEGNPQSPKLRHYWVALDGGAVLGFDAQPDWAQEYWSFKSDRFAPGIGSLVIDVEQKIETIKAGTGPAGALDRTSDPRGGNNQMDPENIAKATDQYQKANVVRLKLLDEPISEFVNERPIPGLMFGWGPEKSGAIAYTDRDGHLILFDQQKHKQTVAGVKDALLPAWTVDGARLAWVQKSGRRKYTLMWAAIGR
jgi:hypothetical protein